MSQVRGRVRSSNHILGDAPGDFVAATETAVLGAGSSFVPGASPLPSILELVRIDGRYGAIDADTDRDGAVSCAELIDVAGQVATLDALATPFDCGEER